MTMINVLLGEHAVFHAQLNHLEQSILAANSSAQVKSQVAMLATGLITHSKLENELLFTTLEPLIGPMPLTIMRIEHDEINQSLKHLLSIEEVEHTQKNLLRLITLTRDHFTQEEKILFPMARKVLKPATLIDLGFQWAIHHNIPLKSEKYEIA